MLPPLSEPSLSHHSFPPGEKEKEDEQGEKETEGETAHQEGHGGEEKARAQTTYLRVCVADRWNHAIRVVSCAFVYLQVCCMRVCLFRAW